MARRMPPRMRLPAILLVSAALVTTLLPVVPAADSGDCVFRAEVGVAACAFHCAPGDVLFVEVAGIGVSAEATCGGAAAACAGTSYCAAESLTRASGGEGACVVTGAVWYAWCGVA